MAELTSEMMNNWCSCLNIIASALESAWSDPLGIQASEFLKNGSKSIDSYIPGVKSLEDTLYNCTLLCEEILSDNPDDSDKHRVRHLTK